MNSFSTLLSKQKAFFLTQQTKSISYRLDALRRLADAIRKYEGDILQALHSDLNKSEFETYTSEVGIVLSEIRFVMNNLQRWSRPKKVKTPLTHIGSRSVIYKEPYGVTLIIAPWNFPFQLAIAPLIGSIAAGNCTIIKPSELTPRTSEVLATIAKDIFDESYVTVVQGGAEVSQALLQEKVDYIFFTGSVAVGKVIMQAAAQHLTPLTLELGGKSPCIVHSDANLKLAAKRIAWGKFMNAGQICVAPDYIYVHQSIKETFMNELKLAIEQLYSAEPLHNEAYTRIVSERHYDRLLAFLNDGDIVIGGGDDRSKLRIEPTVVTNITWDSAIMQEEIFGPILPVLEYTDIEQALIAISDQAKPLALYIFSENKGIQQQVLTCVSFGGGCVNDTIYHLTSPYLPFGGVGSSGMGAYHGQSSYELFSHHKSVLKQTTLFDIPFRYPNVKNGLKRIKLFLK